MLNPDKDQEVGSDNLETVKLLQGMAKYLKAKYGQATDTPFDPQEIQWKTAIQWKVWQLVPIQGEELSFTLPD